MRVKGSILFVAAVTWALHGLADPKPPLSLPGLPPPPQTKVLVSNRTLKGDAWYLPQSFDGPEVTVRMSLTVDLPTGATPCIRYMSDQRLWLRDGNGRLRSDGWYFRWHQTNQLDVATADVITPGVRFVLELVRKDGGLDVSVDGRRLWRLEKDPWPFGWVGFDPRGAKIRIHEVRVTAETFTRPGRDDPARQLRKIADGVGIGKAFPLVDISSETARQSVIAAGTETDYQGHPTAGILEDGRTILVTWTVGHGGPMTHLAESKDGGVTWTQVENRLPDGSGNMVNCPSIYRLADPSGRRRYWIFAAFTWPTALETMMPRIMSEDDGLTWKRMPPLGRDFACVMAFTSMVRLKDGSYLAVFHRGRETVDCPRQVLTSVTRDGGFTWSRPKLVFSGERDCCEPCVFRSPDGRTLAMLLRTEGRWSSSLMGFSSDEGETWPVPVETHWALTGDRHQVLQLPDGRLFVAFRDMAPNSPSKGSFVGWVGTFDELRHARQGNSYRIKLMHNYDGCDSGYPGLVQTADGTIVAVTYLKYWNDKRRQSVVATRFKVSETDRKASDLKK